MLKSGVFHAFVHTQGRLSDLGAAIEALHGDGPVESVAYGINDAGQVIGRYYVTGANGQFAFRGFIATPLTSLLDALLREVKGVGPGKSLQDKVTQSRAAYLAQNKVGVCSGLSSLRKEIAAQTGKKIPIAKAASLESEATVISTTLGC